MRLTIFSITIISELQRAQERVAAWRTGWQQAEATLKMVMDERDDAVEQLQMADRALAVQGARVEELQARIDQLECEVDRAECGCNCGNH